MYRLLYQHIASALALNLGHDYNHQRRHCVAWLFDVDDASRLQIPEYRKISITGPTISAQTDDILKLSRLPARYRLVF